MDNFFAVEQEIRTRLIATVEEIRGVFLTESLASIIEDAPTITPSIYLAYDNYDEPKSNSVNSNSLILPQKWVVILVTRNSTSKLYSSKDGKESSGVLLGKVLSALLNWQPPGTYRGLQLLAAPKPMYSTEGVDYYSLTFMAHIVVKVLQP